MRRSHILVALCLLLCFVAVLVLPACGKKVSYEQTSQQHILFLGDSIAEGIAGPAPLESRENYAYFGILGQINGYTYNNRAISGNQTGEFLSYISREDQDAYRTNTLIREADIICISIGGNDLLFSNFPHMIYEFAARERFGDSFVDEDVVQKAFVYHRHGTIRGEDGELIRDENGELVYATPGTGIAAYEYVMAWVKVNVNAIIAQLRKLNPNAHIFFQNVYNPVDDESEMIPIDLKQDMEKLDSKYKWDENGVAEYRRLGFQLLGGLSDTISACVQDSNDQSIHFVDMSKVFDEVYKADTEAGKELIFIDGVHPSDQGHAVIAATLQNEFVKLGLAESVQSLANYKVLRKEQLDRNYAQVQGFDLAAAKAAIDNATTIQGVSDAYFASIKGVTPTLNASPTQGHVTNGVAVAEKKIYRLNTVTLGKSDEATQTKINGILAIAKKTYLKDYDFTVNPNGTASLRITVKDAGELLGALGLDGSIIGGLEDNCYVYDDPDKAPTGLKLSGALDTYYTIRVYADALFPGLDFEGGHLGKNFVMLYKSLGVGFEGMDSIFATEYTDYEGLPVDGEVEGAIDEATIGRTYESYLDYVVAYLSRYSTVVDAEGKTLHVDRLPKGIDDKLARLKNITIKLDLCYSLVQVQGHDGAQYTALYCGDYNEKTSPWFILTLGENDKGKETLEFYLAMADIRVQFVEK